MKQTIRSAFAALFMAVSSVGAMAVQNPYAVGVIVDYRTEGVATVGTPYPVTIDISRVDARGAKVSFSGDGTLVLSHAQERKVPQGATSLTLFATPSANGLAFIYVKTRQGTAMTATPIPVQVGPAGR